MIINNRAAEADALFIMLPLLGVVVGAGTLIGFVASLCAGLA